jgi:type VI secretion system secreted protein Hcp
MALDADIKVTGSKQGAFKHQSPIKSRQGTSVVTRSQHEIDAPRDAHTGLASGKRHHLPFEVELPADSSLINFQTAIVNNEVLSTVMIRYYQTAANTLTQGGPGGSGGEAKPYYTVELTNAVVSKFEWDQPFSRAVDPEIKNKENHIVVHFTYQKITATWVEGGVTFSDDWLVGSQ